MTVCVLCITVEGLDYGDHTVRVRAARAEGDAAEARAMPERGGLQRSLSKGHAAGPSGRARGLLNRLG